MDGTGRYLTVIVLLISSVDISIYGSVVDDLKYFETLHHDSIHHRVQKRSVSGIEEKLVTFKSHGRPFKLHLQPDSSILSDDFQLMMIDKRNHPTSVEYRPDSYKGYVEDEPTTSAVNAYYDSDGTLTAQIQTSTDTYVIEPSWRHLPQSDNYTLITYRASDLQEHGSNHRTTCGHSLMGTKPYKNRQARSSGDSLNQDSGRSKQSTCRVHPDRRVCSLLLVADYQFHKLMGLKDKAKTANYLIGLVDRIDELFRAQEFGDCGTGFGFQIKQIKIYESPTQDHRDPPRHFNAEEFALNATASELLRSFDSPIYSNANYSDVCLAHLFTAIRFESGILGYSNVAEATPNDSGGICSRNALHREGYVNTGWTTLLNSRRERVVNLQATLVTAHEFGHNWGSAHDEDVTKDQICLPPSASGGRFLMYEYSVSGLEPNNRNLSPCSRRTIRAVLNEKANKCFTSKSKSFCGNSKIEEGEECDEGPESETLKVRCCHKCRLLPGFNCSDANSECCENCTFAPSTTVCHKEDDVICRMASNCTGTSAKCPQPKQKPNGFPCQKSEYKSKCRNGQCLYPCQYLNMTSCQCSGENSCRWCCKNHSNATCNVIVTQSDMDIDITEEDYLPDEWPCESGYCEKGKCQQRVLNSFQRLWSIIEFKSVDQWVKFMYNNIVGTVIILSLVLWIPASCFISYIDRRREREEEEELKWLQKDNTSLIQDQSDVRILSSNQPRERQRLTLTIPR